MQTLVCGGCGRNYKTVRQVVECLSQHPALNTWDRLGLVMRMQARKN